MTRTIRLSDVPLAISMSPDNKYVYITVRSGTLEVFDKKTYTRVRATTVSRPSGPAAFNRDGTIVYVPSASNYVSVIDATTGITKAVVNGVTGPTAVYIDDNAGTGFVTTSSGTIAAFHTTDNKIFATMVSGVVTPLLDVVRATVCP